MMNYKRNRNKNRDRTSSVKSENEFEQPFPITISIRDTSSSSAGTNASATSVVRPSSDDFRDEGNYQRIKKNRALTGKSSNDPVANNSPTTHATTSASTFASTSASTSVISGTCTIREQSRFIDSSSTTNKKGAKRNSLLSKSSSSSSSSSSSPIEAAPQITFSNALLEAEADMSFDDSTNTSCTTDDDTDDNSGIKMDSDVDANTNIYADVDAGTGTDGDDDGDGLSLSTCSTYSNNIPLIQGQMKITATASTDNDDDNNDDDNAAKNIKTTSTNTNTKRTKENPKIIINANLDALSTQFPKQKPHQHLTQQQQPQQQQPQKLKKLSPKQNDHEIHLNHERLFSEEDNHNNDENHDNDGTSTTFSSCYSQASLSTLGSTSHSIANQKQKQQQKQQLHEEKKQQKQQQQQLHRRKKYQDNDNGSVISNITNGTAMTSFTYGEQSTLGRPVKFMFSGNFSVKDMDHKSQCRYLDDNGNDGGNVNGNADVDDGSYISSHFGDNDEYSFFNHFDDDADGANNNTNRNSPNEKNELNNNYDTDDNGSIKPTKIITLKHKHHRRHKSQERHERQEQHNQQQSPNTSYETAYMPATGEEGSNLLDQFYLKHEQQQHQHHPDLSNIIVTPDQNQRKKQKEKATLTNIILNTAAKEKDEKHRKIVLDVVSQNVDAAEKNARTMQNAIQSLDYMKEQKILSPQQQKRGNSRRVSTKSITSIQDIPQQSKHPQGNDIVEHYSSFVELPKTNIIGEGSYDDSSPATKEYLSTQERIITKLIEPGCRKMKQFVSQFNNDSVDGKNNNRWCFDSPNGKTPKKRNTRCQDSSLNDDESNQWYLQKTTDTEETYYYQPSTGAITFQKPPSYNKENEKGKDADTSLCSKMYQNSSRINPHNLLHLVSPIYVKKSKRRRESIGQCEDDVDEDDVIECDPLRLMVYNFLGYGFSLFIISIVYCIWYQKHFNLDFIPEGFLRSIVEDVNIYLIRA